jgi:hypothetical protein
MSKLVIDLCSGLEGFSQAFKNNPDYQVITIELDKKFKPTICADIRYLPLQPNLKPKALLMSPPCNHFSFACLQFPRVGVKLALEIVGACFEAVAYLKPEKWLIENPRGRLRHILGKPKQTIRYSDYDKEIKWMKTTDFWGNIMFPMSKGERRMQHTTGLTHLERLRMFPANKKLSAERAKVPMGVSMAVKEAIELPCLTT